MAAEIIRPDFRSRPREISDNPIFRAIDELASYETPNMRWLREAGEQMRRMNEESRVDPEPPEAA